jgi:hypothetical protein
MNDGRYMEHSMNQDQGLYWQGPIPTCLCLPRLLAGWIESRADNR